LWGVIEHFENPAIAISAIYKLLNKEGIVCLYTSDISSIVAKILGKRWWFIQGQHIQLFTKKSINKLMTDNGFEILYNGIHPYVVTSKSLHNFVKRYTLVTKILSPLLNNKKFLNSSLSFSIKIPGEFYGIYKKI